MSPFTAFFESLHSAWIDELTERFPEPKPELGMPQKFSVLQAPSLEIAEVLRVEVDIDGRKGVVLLAVSKKAIHELNCGAGALWASIALRAVKEFQFRKIQPRLSEEALHLDANWTKKRIDGMSRLVWVPVSLGGAQCFLGVGA